LFFASVYLQCNILFSGFLITQKDANPFFGFLFETSFTQHAANAGVTSLLGYNRTKLDCDEMYCHFQDPKMFLDFLGVDNEVTLKTVMILTVFIFLLRAIAFFAMNHKLKC
jgi:hypothetical protein